MRPAMTTAQFWAAALERAVKTAAQVAAALIGTGAVGVTELDWQQIGSVAVTAAVVSILTSLASDRVGLPGPSLVGESVPSGPPDPAPVMPPELLAQTVAPLPTSTPAVYPIRRPDDAVHPIVGEPPTPAVGGDPMTRTGQ